MLDMLLGTAIKNWNQVFPSENAGIELYHWIRQLYNCQNIRITYIAFCYAIMWYCGRLIRQKCNNSISCECDLKFFLSFYNLIKMPYALCSCPFHFSDFRSFISWLNIEFLFSSLWYFFHTKLQTPLCNFARLWAYLHRMHIVSVQILLHIIKSLIRQVLIA